MSKTMGPDTLAALALVPEQLPGYVRSIAGSDLRFAQGFAVYLSRAAEGSTAVLIACPQAGEADLESLASENPPPLPDPKVDLAIAEVSAWEGVANISVLGPARPASAPVDAPGYSETRDSYLVIDLPFFTAGENFCGVPLQKLRNMLRRAARDLDVAVEPWSAELQSLAKSYATSRVLEAGTRYIFEHLEAYTRLPQLQVFTARHKNDGSLQGLCIGDFTPYATAFYMFAFRRKEAVPGTADLLLYEMVKEAQEAGHERVNLGLAINGGIGFFKQKWGARHFMPLVECAWPVQRAQKGFFKSLFG